MAIDHRRDPGIVGRDQEQKRLEALIERAAEGSGMLVLVSGEAGIGKTTLVRDLTRQAIGRGWLVLQGGCYDLTTTPPYGPWSEAIRSYQPAEQQASVPTLFNNPTDLEQISGQAAYFEETRRFFASIADQQPLLIVLEDLHWADQGSLDLLRYLARQVSSSRILIAATYRSDELHRHHPLYTLLPLVIREANAERFELRRLNTEDHRALIASRYPLREEDAARLEDYLETHAEGNPLFALELLRSLEEEGTLQQVNEGWSLGDTSRVRVPPLLRQVIERRLDRLENEVRSLLQVAAIIGQEVPVELWQQVTGASDEEIAAAIEQGQATYLLQEIPGGESYRFQHALLREALYDSMISLRRRGWHRNVADALAAGAKPVPDTVAYHFQQGGDVRAVAWLLESARRARMTFATATAIERLESALLLSEQNGDISGLRGWLLAALAGSGELFAQIDERMRMLNEAMDIATKTQDDALASLVEWYRAMIETNFSAPVGEMLENARDRIEKLPPNERKRLFGFIYGVAGGALDPSSPDVACLVIGFQAQSGQYREALAGIERVRAEHPRLSAAAELGIGNALMVCHQALGRPDDALEFYERILASHRRDHILDWAAVVANLKLRDLILVYWPDRIALRHTAADEAIAVVRLAKAEQSFSPEMPDEVGVAWLLLLEGHWKNARRVLEPVVDHWASLTTVAPWMVLSRHQGEPNAGLTRLPIVFPDGPNSAPGRQTFETSVLCMHATIEIALDAGNVDLARSWLACHDRWMEWSGNIPLTTIGHLLWARYHQVTGDRIAAEERAHQALALASDPRQPLALLTTHRFLGKLAINAMALGQAYDHLVQSLELVEACSAPFEKALTLVEIARLRIARGNVGDARLALDEARAICEPLQARPTLDVIAELDATTQAKADEEDIAYGLSPREMDVLRLLVEGKSDREIAGELFLSPRTVMSHVASIRNKLGVDSRTAAASIAIRQGLV